MANSIFTFKQFEITQANAAHKVGTDSVLLAAWANIQYAAKVLDIGAGTGLLSLMVAQRNEKVNIDAIEIDEKTMIDLCINVKKSPFTNQINPILSDFFKHQFANTYNYFILNPPYFDGTPFLINANRLNARHKTQFSWNLFFENCKALSSPNATIGFIVPFQNHENILHIANAAGYKLLNSLQIKSFENSQVIRICIELSLECNSFTKQELVIYNNDKTYTNAYKLLTKDFYLNF
jgi:tRNA1Val (adenine37-N6)-methyltransferase